jgi:hypothetical protein
MNKETTGLRFFRTQDDFAWDPPTMTDFAESIAKHSFQEQAEALLTFFDTVEYFEKFAEKYHPFDKKVQRTGAWIDSLQEAIPGIYVAESFWPLDFLALCGHLKTVGPRYPRRLIALIEYVLSDWDPISYMTHSKKIRWPKFLREEIVTRTEEARTWLQALTHADVFEHQEDE